MKRVTPLVMFLLTTLLVPLAHVEAAGIAGLSITAMDCAGFSMSTYTLTADRDNTGTGQESIEATVRDSVGTLLLITPLSIPLGTYTVDPATYTYDLASPVNGDLTFTITSLAGNSLEEQVAYTFTGYCSIPTATPSPTPIPTETPSPTPTLAATASPTANYVLRSTLVIGDQSYDVAIRMEVTPADYVQVGFSVVIVGLLMTLIFLFVKRGQ